jgi:TatD DNase family protein
MIPFVDIHTHHFPKEDGVFLFNNRFGFDKEIYTSSYFSVGVNPWDADRDINWNEFEKFLSHKNCLAVGECGLDRLKGPRITFQKNVFTKQLDLACQYNKPVIIHCVRAFDELIATCKPYKNKISMLIHGFNKSDDLALQLAGHGFLISLNPSVFNKENFLKTGQIQFFLETDTRSDLSIENVYSQASRFLNIECDTLKMIIYRNFTDIFLANGR